MAIDPVALRAEFDNDPVGQGYAPHLVTGNTAELLRLVNELLQGTSEPVESLPLHIVINAIDISEYVALNNADTLKVDWVMRGESLYVAGGTTRDVLLAAFGPGTATRTALAALVNQLASRATTLFGEAATKGDVRAALKV